MKRAAKPWLVCSLLAFAGSAPASPTTVGAGAVVFGTNCARCHGDEADGRSRLAEVLTTKPANLRQSRLTRAEQERMIRLGGEANGRAALMPAWQGQLSDTDISCLLDFLASVRQPVKAKP